MKLIERYRGALLGLAAADALGTTVEFKSPDEFEPLETIVGGGPFGLRPGEWTDDTSMALCLAESLIEKGGFDAVDQMERYCRWWKEGHLPSTGRCLDIGNTIRAAETRRCRRLRRAISPDRSLGVLSHRQFPRRRVEGSKFGFRRRHLRRDLRATCGRVLWRIGNSCGMAPDSGQAGTDRVDG